MQGLYLSFGYGGEFHLEGEKPHHKDAECPPEKLPGPYRRDAEEPGFRIGWITKDPVANDRAWADTEEKPDDGDDPRDGYQPSFFRGQAGMLAEEAMEYHFMLLFTLVLGHGRNDDS